MYTITTKLSLDEAVMHTKGWMNRSPGWVLTSENDKSLSYTRTKKPNLLIFILLLLVWVFPGILYLIFSWGKETRNLFFKGVGKGRTQIMLEAGKQTIQDGRYLAKHLAQFDPELEAPPIPQAPPPSKASFYWFCAFLGFIALIVVIAFLAATLH